MSEDREAAERWLAAYEAAAKREADFDTLSGEELKPLYTPADTSIDHDRDLGYPGEYPFTRGVYPTMYRGRLWTIRQFSGFGNAAATNARYKMLLRSGGTGLSVAYDMPTLMGRDSDDPRSEGEVGHCGVAVDSIADMETLFSDIPLGDITTSMTISGPAVVLFAMYLVAAERQGVAWRDLDGTLQTDILKEYIAQKEWVFPPEPHLRLMADLFEFCASEVPSYHPVSVSWYHIREAGSTAAQELAFTLADGFAYVELAQQRGIAIDRFGPMLSFFFDAHIDFFEEIAKFRAARRIWARWARDRYGATTLKAMQLKFHTQTAGVSLTAQQPYNNVVRTAIEALAGVLGGTPSLHTNALDEVLALPTEEAAAIALRTQQVIAHETGAANVIDPLGGSWFVEKLTDETEDAARAYFHKIEDLGGVLPAIESGFFQREIADASFRYQREIDEHERTIVGVNDYVMDEPIEIPILDMDPQGYDRQVERLNEIRRSRDNRETARTLKALESALRNNENVMPYLLDAVNAYATLQECCDVMRDVLGVYQEAAIV